MIKSRAAFLRVIALGVIAIFAVVRLFFLPPFMQTSSKQLDTNLVKMLQEYGATEIIQKQQTNRADLLQVQFRLGQCAEPILALQALTLEDLTAVLNMAAPKWQSHNVQVYYLGQGLDLTDRIGLKLTAVSEFVRYRLGLSSAAPSAYLYMLIKPYNCSATDDLKWQYVWQN